MITRQQLIDLLNSKEDFLLIDVRQPEEIKNYGKIQQATNIPLDKLEQQLKNINKDKLLIFYCRSGGRSQKATKLAKRLGFNAKNYDGSILEWAKYDGSVQAY